MAGHQIDQNASSGDITLEQIRNFESEAGNAISVDITNPQAYQVFTFQINSSPVGDFDFFISYDGINFIAARTWVMGAGMYTTTTTGVGLARFSVNVTGARTFRVIKRTNGAAAVMHVRQHHFVEAHLQRSRH